MKIEKIIQILNKEYKIKVWREKPFKVLISTILSQRTKDEVTRKASKKLFEFADTPEKILRLSEKQIVELIYPVGFYRQKAKRIKKICRILLEKYRGKVPSEREELLKLPGVGYKTADIVLCYGHGIPSIAIDTHCNRIPKRIGLVPEDTNLSEIKNFLEKSIPKDRWYLVNNILVQFGKDICRPVKPRCNLCPINSFCKYYKTHHLNKR